MVLAEVAPAKAVVAVLAVLLVEQTQVEELEMVRSAVLMEVAGLA